MAGRFNPTVRATETAPRCSRLGYASLFRRLASFSTGMLDGVFFYGGRKGRTGILLRRQFGMRGAGVSGVFADGGVGGGGNRFNAW